MLGLKCAWYVVWLNVCFTVAWTPKKFFLSLWYTLYALLVGESGPSAAITMSGVILISLLFLVSLMMRVEFSFFSKLCERYIFAPCSVALFAK